MTSADTAGTPGASWDGADATPILSARGLTKTYGRVEALRGADFDLYPGEILAVIGDNGAGKSTLTACLSGAAVPDRGQIYLGGQPVHFHTPQDAKAAGIEVVYQNLAVAPALDIASNLFLGREIRRKGPLGSIFRMLDVRLMRAEAEKYVSRLGIQTLQDIGQAVETLSGGQRQAVAVARAAAFGSRVVILDEPTAALGVRESHQVMDIVRQLRNSGLPVMIISHDMPQVFELADRIHIQRLGRRVAVVSPRTHTMEDAVAIMTGARAVDDEPR